MSYLQIPDFTTTCEATSLTTTTPMIQPERSDEDERIRALSQYVILDNATQERLDRITRLAVEVFKVSASFVSFVGRSQVWAKSSFGLEIPAYERRGSFCSHTIQSDQVFVVEDARDHPDFSASELVSGDLASRFYAGAPIYSSEGFPLGAFGILSTSPRTLDPGEDLILTEFASMVSDALATARQREGPSRAELDVGFLDFAVFDALGVGLAIIDDSGAFVRINEKFSAVYGYDPSELAGEPFTLLLPPEARERALKLHRAFLEGAPHPSGTSRARREDGSSFDVDLASERIVLDDGRRYRALTLRSGDAPDINGHHAAGLRDQYRHVVETARDIIFQTDDIGRFIFLNQAWTTTTGFNIQECLGKQLLEFMHPGDRSGVQKSFESFIRGDTASFEQEARLLTAEHGYRWVHIEADVWTDAHGATIGCTGALADITPRRESEERLERSESVEALALEIVSRLANAPAARLNSSVNLALREIGTFAVADRSFVTTFEHDGATVRRVFEWCAPDVPSQLRNYRALPSEMMPWLSEQLKAGKTVQFSNVSDLPETAASEQNILSSQQVRSFVAVPIQLADEFTGFVGCETTSRTVTWPKETISILKIVGQVILSEIGRAEREKILRAAHHQFELLSRHSRDLILLLDSDARIRYASPSAVKALAPNMKVIAGRELDLWVHPHDRSKVLECQAEAMAKGEPVRARFHLKRYRGDWFLVEGLFERRSDDEYRGIVVSAREVRPGYIVQEYLADREGEFQAILEQAVELVLAVSAEHTINYLNPSGSSALGYSEESPAGRAVTDLVHPDDGQVLIDLLVSAGQSGGRRVKSVELRMKHADGSYHHYQMAATDLQNHPEVKCIVCVGHDIQQLKQIQHDLHRASRQAEELARLNMMFLANMSHEIRTPLSGILGFASVLVEELGGEHQEFAEIIEQSGRRLMDTLNSVLDLARVESTGRVQAGERIEVMKETELAMRLLRPVAEAKSLDLRLEADDESIDAEIDRSHFHRILNNIIGNAIKFTQQGHVSVKLRADRQNVYVEVKDTGVGMSKEYLSRVFDEFTQESGDPDTLREGSGLGLAITRRLVELLDGQISIDTEKGKGTTLHVILPRYRSHPANSGDIGTATGVKRDPSHHKARILTVDDNRMSRVLVKRILEPEYHVDAAASAREAEELLAGHSYRAILLDINLGKGKSGVDMLEDIKASSQYHRVPVVALTAYALPGDREKFLRTGFDHYLGKPYTRQELIDLVENILTAA